MSDIDDALEWAYSGLPDARASNFIDDDRAKAKILANAYRSQAAQIEKLEARKRQLEAACILGDAAEAMVRKLIIKENEVLIPYLEMKSRAESAEALANLAIRAREAVFDDPGDAVRWGEACNNYKQLRGEQ